MSVGRARQNRLENILKYTYHFASQTDNKLPCKIKLAHTVPLVCGRLVNLNGSVEKNGYCATEHEGSKLNFFDKSLRPKSQQSSYETKFAGASIVPGYKQICQTPRETVSFVSRESRCFRRRSQWQHQDSRENKTNSNWFLLYFQAFTSTGTKEQLGQIEKFTLIVASWVIRARRREIRRFVLEFKAS